ncbi:hypothetical protein [Salinibacterium sp. CAN_S4]|uniref:hypothetical protein n=1 Tax=Salinibacterium sp. CAN_S4 TaxID=2787727 RepID=UPI0018EF7F5E
MTRPDQDSGDDKNEKKASSFLSMSIGGRGSGTPKAKPLSLGGAPRADLLPPEVGEGNRAKSVRRGLKLGILGVLVIVLAATGGAWFLAFIAHNNLIASQDETVVLLADQAAHAEVRDVKNNVAVSKAAQEVGGSTEIDWKTYLLALQATLPAGVIVTGVDTDTASPVTDFAQSTVPLEGGRIGTLVFAAASPTLPSIPTWLNGLKSLPGFVDAVPNSVTQQTDGSYTASITMHINAEAYSGRFAPKLPDAEATATAEDGN